MPKIVVTIEPLHRPHELLLLVTSVLLGSFYLFGLPPPTSVAATQPTWMIRVWAIALLISGTAGLAGCFWRNNIEKGLRLEAGAMDLGAATMLLYVMSLFTYAGERALSSSITFVLWACANIWRARQAQRQIRELEK